MKKVKDPSKNKHDLPILKPTVSAGTPVPETTSGKSEEHHGLVVFSTDEDRRKFWNKFGKDAYPRKVVRAKFGTTPVTYEQAAEVAAPAAEFLKKLINKTADGPSGPCVYASEKKCLSHPNFMFVPFSEAMIDTWDPLQPKHAVVKKWIGEEFTTLLKVALPNGTDKSYYLFPDGRVGKKEHGAMVFVSTDEANMVFAEGKTIPRYKGRFFVDYVDRKVNGPLCYKCEEALVKKHGQGAVLLTSKAAAEAELARFIKQEEADKEYQRRRKERENELIATNAAALDDLALRSKRPSKFSDGRPGSGKTWRTSGMTRDRSRGRERRDEQ